MASQFTLPLTAQGAVTAPADAFTFVEPTAQTRTFIDIGPVNILELPEYGYAVADGVNPLRLVTRGTIYNANSIAPSVAPTAAGTGARSTLVQTFTAATVPANNDEFTINTHSGYFIRIRFVTALTATTDAFYDYCCEVKIGSGGTGAQNLAQTIARVEDVINHDPAVVEGTDFHWRSVYLTYAEIVDNLRVTVSATTATTITYRATTYGAAMNLWSGLEIVGATWDLGGVAALTTAYFSGGTDSTGTAPGIGRFRYFFTWVNPTTGVESGRSPITTIDNATVGNVAISGITVSPDVGFSFARIYRTAELGTEFYPCKDLPNSSGSFTDDMEDATLVLGSAWDELLHPSYAEGPPPRGMALAFWKGRLWSLGAHLAADYVKGTVSVTQDSASITFSVLGVTERMARRTFMVDGVNDSYTIISVDQAAGTAVLDRAYSGVTAAAAAFTIKDAYNANQIRCTPEFLFGQWPENESPGEVDSDDPRGGIGLLATKARLYAFSRSSIVAVTGNDLDSWELSKVGQGVGLAGTRLVVGVGDGGMFLSPDGFYVLGANEELSCISSPKAPKKMLAVGIDDTVKRVNWAMAHMGYSYYDTANRVVCFGLPLDGALTANYEIVFDLQNRTWTTYKRAGWTDATQITMPDGSQAVLAGDRTGQVWHVEIGESDGFYGTEAVQTLTGAQTVRALTVTGTPFSTTGDGEKGKPFIVLYADRTTVAYGKVGSNTTSVITPEEDLDVAPAADDQIILGGIDAWARSGFTTFGEEYRQKTLRAVTARFAPIARGSYFFAFAVNGGTFALPTVGTGIGDLTTSSGKIRHFVQWPGDTHAIQFRRFQPGGRAVLRGGIFDLHLREAPSA